LSLKPNLEEIKLNKEQLIKRYKLKFERLGLKVEKISRPEGDATFTVEFANAMKAQQALSKAEEIGNKLEPKKLQRPTPKEPRLFEVLSHTLTVRAGRTMKSIISPEKEKKNGERIIVNRTKGRRARLWEKENGSWKNAGWVSLFSSKGVPLMLQLEEDDFSIEDKINLEAAQEKNSLE